MGAAGTGHLTEIEVIRVWQKRLRKGRHLADSEGQPVEVVYPGRPNDSRGGDFRDAVVAAGRARRSGCIEVHTRASGWQAHGHHRDAAYNQVVLHVAMEQDRKEKTLLENGQAVPTVILDQPRPADVPGHQSEAGLPCYGRGGRPIAESRLESLDKAGDARLAAKAARYKLELSQIEAGQSLYQGILEALGYAKNKGPFLELSHRLPLRFLEEKVLESGDSRDSCLLRLQAFLLGNAGLLPSQRSIQVRGEEYIDELERIWADCPFPAALPYPQWELFKVRPGNYPVRRIAALSYWLYANHRKGWLPAWLGLVREAPQPVRVELESALVVKAEGFWARCYDFGSSGAAVSPVLLGRERASEIIVNVVLPFALAWSRMKGETALGRKVRQVYQHYCRLEVNSLEQHMLSQLAISRRQVNSARRQQGLIHIYQTRCTQGKCRACAWAR